jgi:hypothetical protein
MPSRKSSAVRFIFPGLILLLLLGCEEGPLGFDELGRGELEVHQVVLEPDTVAGFSKQIALGEATTLIGGRDSLTEARILISIGGLDSIVAFDSVKLCLRRYPADEIDQSDVLFRIYPVTADWEEEGCTWMLADAYHNWWPTLGGVFDSTDLVGEIEVDEDTVELRLDPDRLEAYNQGIILLPQNDGFCYMGSDEKESYAPFVLGFEEDDTTKFSSLAGADYYAAVYDATILKPYEAPGEDTLLGAGLAWRVFMRFPLEDLPQDIDVTSADLVVKYQSFFSPENTLDFVCYRLIDEYAGRFSELASAVAGRDSTDVSSDSLSVSFVGVAQFWVDEPDSNFGLMLSHSFLASSPSFGQEKRIHALGRITGTPRLVITYTAVPESRFPGEER